MLRFASLGMTGFFAGLKMTARNIEQANSNNEWRRSFGVDGLKNFGYCVVGLKAECCTAEGLGCDVQENAKIKNQNCGTTS